MTKKHLQLTVPDELLGQLRERAAEHSLTTAGYIRYILTQLVNDRLTPVTAVTAKASKEPDKPAARGKPGRKSKAEKLDDAIETYDLSRERIANMLYTDDAEATALRKAILADERYGRDVIAGLFLMGAYTRKPDGSGFNLDCAERLGSNRRWKTVEEAAPVIHFMEATPGLPFSDPWDRCADEYIEQHQNDLHANRHYVERLPR